MQKLLTKSLDKLIEVLAKFAEVTRFKALAALVSSRWAASVAIGTATTMCMFVMCVGGLALGVGVSPKEHKLPPKPTEETTEISIIAPLPTATAAPTVTPTPAIRLDIPVAGPAYCTQGWFPNTGCACCGTTEVCSDKTMTNRAPDCTKKNNSGGGSSGGAPVTVPK